MFSSYRPICFFGCKPHLIMLVLWHHPKAGAVCVCAMHISCFTENKTRSYNNFCSKRGIIKGCFIFSCTKIHIYSDTEMKIYFKTVIWGRAYIMSILKNQSRAYFWVKSYFLGNCLSF